MWREHLWKDAAQTFFAHNKASLMLVKQIYWPALSALGRSSNTTALSEQRLLASLLCVTSVSSGGRNEQIVVLLRDVGAEVSDIVPHCV